MASNPGLAGRGACVLEQDILTIASSFGWDVKEPRAIIVKKKACPGVYGVSGFAPWAPSRVGMYALQIVVLSTKKVSWSQKWKQYTPFGRIVLKYFKHNFLVWVFCNFFLHFELSICHNHGRSHHIQRWLSEKYLRLIKAVFKGVIKDVFKMYVHVNDLMNITCFHEHDIVHI